jgi:hypothetical protein
MPAIIQTILETVLWFSTFFGLALMAGGAWLVYLGATEDMELLLFGNWLKASRVGAVGMFCGAVVVGMIFRTFARMIRTRNPRIPRNSLFEASVPCRLAHVSSETARPETAQDRRPSMMVGDPVYRTGPEIPPAPLGLQGR